MTLTIRPLGPSFAAEVDGLDMRQPLTPTEVAAIHAGMDTYAVLVFHDQKIDDAQQLAFTQSLGDLEHAIGTSLRATQDHRLPTTFADVSNLDRNNTPFARDDRRRLFSSLGALYPHGHAELAGADDFESIRAAMERCPPYRALFARLGYGEAAALDKVLFEEEARRCALTFERQVHYAIFYAYMRLREQEIRNLMWVSECVAQDQKARAPDGVVFLF